MKQNTRSTIIFIIIIIIFLTIKINFNTLLYLNDYAGSLFIKTFGDVTIKDNISIINPEIHKNYTLSYKKLPEGFFQSCFTLFYKLNSKKTINEIAELSINFTGYYEISELIRDIKKVNNINNGIIEKNSIILIPNSLPAYTINLKPEKKPKIIHTRGIYFTGTTSGSRSTLRLIPELKNLGINTIVFDAKDVSGIVNYRSNTELVRFYNTDKNRTIGNIKMLIRSLRENNIYIIARIALFHDQLLYAKDPSLAIQSRKTGKPWKAGKELWCDPTNKKVQDYNLIIAEEIADMGVDEIQFDYIRFPTTGDLNDAKFAYSFGNMKNEEVIAHFLERAYKKISSKNTLLSIDIFGVIAWGKNIDVIKTGQKIELLSKHCDVISPMLYPSHFDYNFDDKDNPADHPYYFIYEGCKKILNMTGKQTVVRPWLQAFKWRASNFNSKYILDQIEASDNSGSRGYLFWNASNNYDTVFDAMKYLIKKKDLN